MVVTSLADIDIRAERLADDTLLTPFDCGNKDINDFLVTDAKPYLSQLIGVTYVFYCNADIVAYYTVSNDKLINDPRIFKNRSEFKKALRDVPHNKRGHGGPAVKIGRLGVSTKYKRLGIGTYIIDAIKVSFTKMNKTGCRFILVDAKNTPDVKTFYEANGFKVLTVTDEHDETRLMYFDLMRFVSAGSTPPLQATP